MPQNPLLKFPNARSANRRPGIPDRSPRPQGPGRTAQMERFATTFRRLERALNTDEPTVELRADPNGIAPERALVFVTAGSINNFKRAAESVGLVVLDESDTPQDVPDGFSQGNTNAFSPMLYAVMPSLESLRNILRLRRAYENGDMLRGNAPWRNLFDLLVDLRVWGPEDRLSVNSRQMIREMLPENAPEAPVILEIELHRNDRAADAENWHQNISNTTVELGGKVITSCQIRRNNFAYNACLVELPTLQVEQMLDDPNIEGSLACVEGIKTILPQCIAQAYPHTGNQVNTIDLELTELDEFLPARCLLLDGTVMVGHSAVEGGILIEDVNDLVRLSQLTNRKHATSMASLILRGDLIADGEPLKDSKIINVPVLLDADDGSAASPSDRLFVDVIYSSLLQIFENDDNIADDIFVVNLSIGIGHERFAGRVSALARLLDWWSWEYGVLFVISAGNISEPIELPGIRARDFEDADEATQRNIVRSAIDKSAYGRTLLAPAECINGLTVGSLAADLGPSEYDPIAYAPTGEFGAIPDLSSALGLGKSNTVKPDIINYGGVHQFSIVPSNGGAKLIPRSNSGRNGLFTANPLGGQNNSIVRARGTSCAAALTTRAILTCANALIGPEGPFAGVELPRRDLALLTRALAVNSTSWTKDAHSLLTHQKEENSLHHIHAKELVAKHYGYGVLDLNRMIAVDSNSATLVSLGSISRDGAFVHDFPLPESISGISLNRRLNITIAWFSPIDSVGARYRMAALEAFAGEYYEDDDSEWAIGMKPEGIDRNTIARGSVWSKKFVKRRRPVTNFDADATLPIRVQCKDASGGNLDPDHEIRFALVATLSVEEETDYKIFEQVSERVRLRLRQA